MSHQWRGVIEEYRDRLDIPENTPTITLREGGTPLVDSRWLSGLTGAEVWLKVEGDNPTGSFKDRGMTVALSVAVGQGAEAVAAPPREDARGAGFCEADREFLAVAARHVPRATVAEVFALG